MDRLKQLFDEIQRAKEELGFRADEECFYRGQSDETWPLLPSLLRHAHATGLADGRRRTDLIRLEATLFYEFQARAQELHARTLSGWDVLFFMRHHGVATRVLDWTETLGVALYFAVNGWKDGRTPCVWLLNPYALNESTQSEGCRDLVAPQFLRGADGEVRDYARFMSGSFPRFGWDAPVALYPRQYSGRLHAQRGYFTIHGEDLGACQDQPVTSQHLRKVRLDSPELIAEVRELLQAMGIDTHLLFPDLDGLARYLHDKYRILQPTHQLKYGTNGSSDGVTQTAPPGTGRSAGPSARPAPGRPGSRRPPTRT